MKKIWVDINKKSIESVMGRKVHLIGKDIRLKVEKKETFLEFDENNKVIFDEIGFNPCTITTVEFSRTHGDFIYTINMKDQYYLITFDELIECFQVHLECPQEKVQNNDTNSREWVDIDSDSFDDIGGKTIRLKQDSEEDFKKAWRRNKDYVNVYGFDPVTVDHKTRRSGVWVKGKDNSFYLSKNELINYFQVLIEDKGEENMSSWTSSRKWVDVNENIVGNLLNKEVRLKKGLEHKLESLSRANIVYISDVGNEPSVVSRVEGSGYIIKYNTPRRTKYMHLTNTELISCFQVLLDESELLEYESKSPRPEEENKTKMVTKEEIKTPLTASKALEKTNQRKEEMIKETFLNIEKEIKKNINVGSSILKWEYRFEYTHIQNSLETIMDYFKELGYTVTLNKTEEHILICWGE